MGLVEGFSGVKRGTGDTLNSPMTNVGCASILACNCATHPCVGQPSGAFLKITATVCDFCPAGTVTLLTADGLKSVPEPGAVAKELLGDNCQKTFSPPLLAVSIKVIENVSVSPSFGSVEPEGFR